MRPNLDTMERMAAGGRGCNRKSRTIAPTPLPRAVPWPRSLSLCRSARVCAVHVLLLLLPLLCAASVVTSTLHAQNASQILAPNPKPRAGFAIPNAWTRRGVVLERHRSDRGVSGIGGLA